MIEYLFCAFRNLGRKKLRTALTVSGIAIGVASVIIIGAIGEGGKNAVSNQLDSLGINGLNIAVKYGEQDSVFIDDNDVKACMSVAGVQAAMPIIMQSGTTTLHGYNKSTLYWGVGSEAQQIFSLKLLYGSMFSKSDIVNHGKVCLVDDSFAKEFFKRSNVTGENLTVNLGTSSQEMTIKGVIATGSSIVYNLVGDYMPAFIYLPYTTAGDLRSSYGYDQIAVKTSSVAHMDAIGDHLASLLSTKNYAPDSFVASNMFKQKQRLSELLGIVTLIISAIGAISLIVAGLSIMTVMTVSVSERTREIGIKKAIGAKKQVILLEFLFEALAISMFGGAIGIAAGAGISYLASVILRFAFSVRAESILYSSCFAVFTGVLFGVYPAVKASRLKPVDALRHE